VSDDLIFVLVVGARFLVPLLIPRFPLPAILAALVIDAADQTIFQEYTDLDLENYQGYDKALDVYYLTIAFVATMKNWANPFAFQVARFLWYYRLVGVTAFELTQQRWMLLVFANTFEYMFIFYEGVRTSWNPARLGRKGVLLATAGIWIFIKLPQEWWIHVAQLDFTDFMKEDVFGVEATASWGDAFSNRPAVTAFLLVAIVGLVVAAWIGARRLPPRDWKFTLDADVVSRHLGWTALPRPGAWTEPVRGWATLEKIALITLVTVIFSQMLPGTEVSGLRIAAGVTVLVVANAGMATWRARRELEWGSTFARFVALSAVNLGLLGLFFAMLISLIIVLFDRYRRIRSARLAALGAPDDANPTVGLDRVSPTT
jgi:hypothetical protein